MGGVDIVVPCYNAQATLAATIESALAQDAVSAVVVVDDGSTDGSLALARLYAPRVTVLTGPNRGVAAARNRGAAHTDAAWLLFLDADDLLTPGTVARRLAAIREGGADASISDWEEFLDGEESKPGRSRSLEWASLRADAERATATRVWAPPAAILYRRTLFARTGGFRGDVSPIEDARMLFDAARLGARFVHAAHTGARYRIAPGSLSRADPALFWSRVLRNGHQIEAAWREDGTLSTERRRAVAEIYDAAGRGLLRAAHPEYFAALAGLRRLGLPRTLHSRVAGPLARILGLATARTILALAGRA